MSKALLAIDPVVRDKLKSIMGKDDTYSDTIEHLITYVEKSEGSIEKILQVVKN